MPIEWNIDHAKRLVVADCRGAVNRLEIEDYLDKVVVADALPYRKIFDVSDARLALDDADMMALGARVRAYSGISDMGPLAIVVTSIDSENRARQFATLGGANRPIRIFESTAAAERWIEDQLPTDHRHARPTSSPRSVLMVL